MFRPDFTMARVLMATGFIAGCSGEGFSTDEQTTETAQPLLEGAMPVTQDGTPNASETATQISKVGSSVRHVVAFNFHDPTYTTYTPTGRTVASGAAHTGYASAPGINVPFGAPQRLVPPQGWPVLWGDPGLGQTKGTNYMYLSSLAVPAEKMPTSGVIVDATMEDALGGACIARSTNQGQTFSLSASDCLHNSFAFYDGTDVTGTTPSGPVYAAFNNYNAAAIDIWRAPSPTGTFTMLPDPFPGKEMYGHPRIVASGASVTMLGADLGNRLWLTSCGTTCSEPRLVTTQYTTQDANIAGQTVRLAAQYDLVKVPGISVAGSTLIVYVSSSNGILTIKGAKCSDNSWAACSDNVFTIAPGTNVFHPTLATASILHPPSPYASTVVKGSWIQQYTNPTFANFVEVRSANLQSATGMITGRVESDAQVPCADNRGYWGDYDVHLGSYQSSSTSNPLFFRSFTDSTYGPCTKWAFKSEPVHVSSTMIAYP